MRLKEKIPIGNHNNNLNTFGKPIGAKKNNIINLTKNKNLSKSPNIKRNISKQKENFHIIEKSKNNNKIHYSNGNINYNHKEINLAQNTKNQNKKIILTKNKNNMNINRQKSPNVNKNLTNNYFQKKNTNYNNVNKKQALTLNHRPVTTKLTINPKKVSNHKYSIIVNNKKKELKRFQTNSNKISKSKDYKLKKIDNNKIINNTTINPIKYYPSYKGNNGQIYNYYNVYNSLPNINNFNVSANHTHYMNKRNTDLNIDIDPGKDLIYDQIDVINSQQKYLTEDGNLINKFKGLTKDSVNKQIYKPVIENIIQTKQNYLNQLQDNIIEYKKLIYNYNQ
jgi:hypothetical protein